MDTKAISRLQDVIEIVRPLESGMTQPYQCRLDDGNLYAVKGRQATQKGLIAEAVSAFLGRRLSLPIPDFQFCRVSKALLEQPSNAQAASALGSGTCFASQWAEPTEVFGLSMARKVGNQVLAQIYVFDHWIGNGDRTLTPQGGNVNLLLSLADESLIVFDHNLAFSPSHVNDDLSLHVGRTSWLKVKDLVGFQTQLRTKMNEAAKHIDDFYDHLPEDWIEAESAFQAEIKSMLRRVDDHQFWTELG